jgi:hypothetical protein
VGGWGVNTRGRENLFVGKYFTNTEARLPTIVLKQGRWIYERSELKVKEKKEKLKASARVTLPEPTAWNEVPSRLRQLFRLT